MYLKVWSFFFITSLNYIFFMLCAYLFYAKISFIWFMATIVLYGVSSHLVGYIEGQKKLTRLIHLEDGSEWKVTLRSDDISSDQS